MEIKSLDLEMEKQALSLAIPAAIGGLGGGGAVHHLSKNIEDPYETAEQRRQRIRENVLLATTLGATTGLGAGVIYENFIRKQNQSTIDRLKNELFAAGMGGATGGLTSQLYPRAVRSSADFLEQMDTKSKRPSRFFRPLTSFLRDTTTPEFVGSRSVQRALRQLAENSSDPELRNLLNRPNEREAREFIANRLEDLQNKMFGSVKGQNVLDRSVLGTNVLDRFRALGGDYGDRYNTLNKYLDYFSNTDATEKNVDEFIKNLIGRDPRYTIDLSEGAEAAQEQFNKLKPTLGNNAIDVVRSLPSVAELENAQQVKNQIERHLRDIIQRQGSNFNGNNVLVELRDRMRKGAINFAGFNPAAYEKTLLEAPEDILKDSKKIYDYALSNFIPSAAAGPIYRDQTGFSVGRDIDMTVEDIRKKLKDPKKKTEALAELNALRDRYVFRPLNEMGLRHHFAGLSPEELINAVNKADLNRLKGMPSFGELQALGDIANTNPNRIASGTRLQNVFNQMIKNPQKFRDITSDSFDDLIRRPSLGNKLLDAVKKFNPFSSAVREHQTRNVLERLAAPKAMETGKILRGMRHFTPIALGTGAGLGMWNLLRNKD